MFLIFFIINCLAVEEREYCKIDYQYKPKDIFFDNKTFGINLYEDPCKKVSNPTFRKFINSS